MEEGIPRLPAGRKAQIAQYVSQVGQVTVSALAELFSVSPDTIRRDLDQLDSDGILIRTHGGAMSTSALPWHDTGLDDRSRLKPAEKEIIGSLAATLVHDGSVLFINAGTTTLAMVRHLSNKRELTIATNNLRIPSEIYPEACRDLYVIGGRVRLSGHVTIGPASFASAFNGAEMGIRADLAFISVGAVDSSGYSTTNLDEAAMLAQMADRAGKVAILADSSKLDKRLFASIGTLSVADYLITDAPVSPQLSEVLAEADVTVLSPLSATDSLTIPHHE